MSPGPDEQRGISRLAARFGGSTLAQQAARQALVNRTRQQLAESSSTEFASTPAYVCNESPLQSNRSTPQHSAPGAQHGLSKRASSRIPDLQAQAAGPGRLGSRNSSLHPASTAEDDMNEILGVMAVLAGPRAHETHESALEQQLSAELGSGHEQQAAGDSPEVPAQRQSDASPSRQRSTTPDSSPIFKQPAGQKSNQRSSKGGARTTSPLHRTRTPSPLQQRPSMQPQPPQEQQQDFNPILKPRKQPISAAISPRASQGLAVSSIQHQRNEHRGPQGKVQQGPAILVKPAVFSFDEAHPVLADRHYLRTHEQNRLLAAQSQQAAADQLQNRPNSASPDKRQLLQLQQQQRPHSPAVTQRRRNSHSGGGWHPHGSQTNSPAKRPQSANPAAAAAARQQQHGAGTAAAVATTLGMLGSNFQDFGPLEYVAAANYADHNPATANQYGSPPKAETAGAASTATAAYGGWTAAAAAEPDSSRAIRDEQMRVLRQAQQAMAVSQQLRTRQNTHLPAASSSIRSSVSAATAAAAAAAAEALASRGTAAAGSRPGWDRRWRTAAEIEQEQQQQQFAPAQQQALEELKQKMSHLQEGLAALAAGKPLPPSAAAALAAALQQTAAQHAAALTSIAAAAARPAAAAASDPRSDELQDVISVINQPGAYADPQQQQQQGTGSSSDNQMQEEGSTDPAAAAAAAGMNAREYELMLASGAYDPKRFEEYNRQLDADMARRAAEADYDSDLEEEAEAVRAANGEAVDALRELQEAEQKLQELANEEQRMKTTWAEQDEWMDEYRQQPRSRTAARQQQQQQQHDADSASDADDEQEEDDQTDLQQQQQVAGRSNSTAAAAARGMAAADAAAAAGAARGHQAAAAAAASTYRRVLSPADEALLRKPFVPLISEEYPEYAVMSDRNNIPYDNMTEYENQGLASGYTSDGPVGYYNRAERSKELGSTAAAAASGGSSARARSVSPQRSTSPFRTTLLQPFEFERRAAVKPKSIAAVKLEQDMALRRQEEEAHLTKRFVANLIPHSTLEPRYQRIIADQAEKRAAAHAKYTTLLSLKESPFSFYCRDKAAAAAKAAKRAAARDPNRFQKPFKAKPVPAHVHESRFQATVAGMEAARLAAKVRAEMAREKAAAKLQESYKKRQELAEAAYRERLERSSPYSASPSKFPSRPKSAPMSHEGSPAAAAAISQLSGGWGSPAGNTSRSGSPGPKHVPNFAGMHAEWEAQMAAKKAANKRRVTVPEEFSLNGSTPDEQAARAQKAAERKARIEQQIQEDERKMKELRWPYVSNRAPMQPTPPPMQFTHLDPVINTVTNRIRNSVTSFVSNSVSNSPVRVGDTLAAQRRAEVVRQAMAEGRYDSQEERDRKQWEAARLEQQRRQQQWQAMQAAEVRRRLAEQQQQSVVTPAGADPAAAAASGSTAAQIDPETAAAAGAAAAAAAGGTVLSTAEIAAHLDKLLSGKASITPMQPAAAAGGGSPAGAAKKTAGDHQRAAAAAAAASPDRMR